MKVCEKVYFDLEDLGQSLHIKDIRFLSDGFGLTADIVLEITDNEVCTKFNIPNEAILNMFATVRTDEDGLPFFVFRASETENCDKEFARDGYKASGVLEFGETGELLVNVHLNDNLLNVLGAYARTQFYHKLGSSFDFTPQILHSETGDYASRPEMIEYVEDYLFVHNWEALLNYKYQDTIEIDYPFTSEDSTSEVNNKEVVYVFQ